MMLERRQTSQRDQPVIYGVDRQGEALQRVGAQERLVLIVREHDDRGSRLPIESYAGLSQFTLDFRTVRKDEYAPAKPQHIELLEHGPRDPRIVRAGVDQGYQRFPTLAEEVPNLYRHTERAHAVSLAS